MSQFFASGGQRVGVSASTSVLVMNIQDWFPLGWTGWISLQPKGLKSHLQHHSSKASILQHSAFFLVKLSYLYMTTEKTIALTRWTFVVKVMSLLSNMLSRLVITFLPRSKRLLISWLQSPSAVILEPPKIKYVTVSTVSPSVCLEVMGLDAVILVFSVLSFNPTFSLSSFSLPSQFFFTFCHKGGVFCISEVIDISPSKLDSSLRFLQSSVSQWPLNRDSVSHKAGIRRWCHL